MWVLEILNPEPRFIERQMRFHTEPSCQPSQDFLKLGGWHSNRYHSLSLLFLTDYYFHGNFGNVYLKWYMSDRTIKGEKSSA